MTLIPMHRMTNQQLLPPHTHTMTGGWGHPWATKSTSEGQEKKHHFDCIAPSSGWHRPSQGGDPEPKVSLQRETGPTENIQLPRILRCLREAPICFSQWTTLNDSASDHWKTKNGAGVISWGWSCVSTVVAPYGRAQSAALTSKPGLCLHLSRDQDD